MVELERLVEPLARCAKGHVQAIKRLARPFSNFQYLIPHSPFRIAGPSLRRIFSEARRAEALSLAVEQIEESEETADETQSLTGRFTSFAHSELYRLTFWGQDWDVAVGTADFVPPLDSLLGYAIVRADYFDDEDAPSVHIFESVFRKYHHFHNFVPCGTTFEVTFAKQSYPVSGVMYCQQNGYRRAGPDGDADKKGKTKACAQVALRSLLATRFANKPVKYAEINSTAKQPEPASGLDSNQIRQVLNHFNVNFRDLDYTAGVISNDDLPYGKLLYAGLENGCGGLLGFELAGIDESGQPITPGRHIIPFFGHTFNQDTWAPRAQNAYFHIGSETRYIPSDEWLSSFIGHDDNFGSNFCVPKGFLNPKNVSYVVALLPNGFEADPLQAEVAAAHVLYTLFSLVPQKYRSSFWFKVLTAHVQNQDIVLRTHAMERTDYTDHVANIQDWDGGSSGLTAEFLESFLPEKLWMVEVSIPEVFSTNYGKLGEIAISGSADLVVDPDAPKKELLFAYLSQVVFVRLPGVVLVRVSLKSEDGLRLVPLQCGITGHAPLFGCPAYH